MTRETEAHIARTPLTADERRQLEETLARIVRRRRSMLAARGGRLFPSSGRELDELRAALEAEPS
jgi:hypothetical protein